MIYIFEIFKHVVSDLAFGWQISRGMLVAFPPPGYLRYLGADYTLFLQCFFIIPDKMPHTGLGLQTELKENSETRKLKVGEGEAHIFSS